MTLEQLIDAAGLEISRATLANIERGKQQTSTFQLAALAAGLSTEVIELFPTETYRQRSSVLTKEVEDLVASL